MHSATSSVEVLRWVKVHNTFVQQPFRRPAAIDTYNKFIDSVDVFDQLASSYRILRHSKKFTKVIFYDLVEVATINAFKLMCAWMAEHPDDIIRGRSYCQYDFRLNLGQQLVSIGLHEEPPLAKRRRYKEDDADLYTKHTAIYADHRADCSVCWKVHQQRVKSSFLCPACRNRKGNPVHLCIKAGKQCFQFYHSHAFDEYR